VKSRSLAVLGSTILVCLLLLTLQAKGYSLPASDLVTTVTAPVQTVLARVSGSALGLWTTYREWKDVRTENQRLREEVQRLRVEALQHTETAGENQRFRHLLGLRERLPLETAAAEIIARDWGGWVRSLTVNRGRSDQITRLTPVISPDGLIGRVVDVRPGVAIVQVLTDPASFVGAHAVSSRTPGIVEGEARGTLRFKYMARSGTPLETGDLIVTSGQGGVFPRGIPIGRVRAIDDRGSALFSYAALTPAVDFARVEEVLLVISDSREDVAAYFGAGG
jgi:rod shape-determining protein MreC